MKKHILYILGILLFVACSDTEEIHAPDQEVNDISQADVILQPRDPSLTNVLSNPKPELKSGNSTPLDHPVRYLGFTYKFGNHIVGHSDNIVRQIIDVESLYDDPDM
jgi:uncharacterized protein YcfL